MLRSLRGPLLLLSIAGALAGCSAAEASEDEDSSYDAITPAAARAFDPNAIFGRAQKRFTTPTGVSEACIIPRHFAEDGYAPKDTKKEDKLCEIDWNAEVGPNASAAALLPKDNSTNPATDILQVTAELPRSAIETQAEANAGSRRKADKLGRFKSSLDPSRFDRTSSYAPSIIAYYGTSRLLGGIAEVVPAVWRTMDVKRHVKVAEMGQELTPPSARIVKTLWHSFVQTDSSNDPKGNLTYTQDGNQLYGALIAKVSGDEKDTSIDTDAKLVASQRYKNLTSTTPVARIAGRDLAAAVSTIVPMQGVAEMLVLDAIMTQGDRLSGDNVSYVPVMYFQKADGSIDRMSKSDYDKARASDPNSVPAGAVEVKKLYLNDVDAGFVHSSRSYQASREFSYLGKVAHLSPDLYARLRKLATIVGTPDFETYAKNEWKLTDNDYDKYKIMVTLVANQVHDRCASGTLVLDLDIAKHVAGTPLAARAGCE